MSKGSLLCAFVLLQALYLCLLAGNQLIAGQIGDEFLCQDPIRRPSLMSSHIGDEFNSTNADPIPDDELVDGQVLVCDEYTEDHGGVPDNVVAGGDLDVAGDEELLLGGHGDDGEAKDSSGEHASGEVQCTECSKRFKNDKSMFGHLRSHPNRGYKGATQPAKKVKSLPNSNDASPASLSPVDDRPVARYSQCDPRLSPYEILAAYVMLTIRYRDNKATQQAPLSSPSCSTRKHESAEQAEAGKEESAMSKTGAEKDNVHNEHGSSVVEVPRKRGRKKSQEGKEAHRKEKDVPSTKEKHPYICKHCKAEFPTHQALGGHMAAHNKDKRNQTQNEQEAGQAFQGKIDQIQNGQEAEGGEERRCDGQSLSSRGLQTKHFYKVFNKGWHSGEEPGGYMRQQHFERKDDGLPPVAARTADGDWRRLFDIDLNVEAPEQE